MSLVTINTDNSFAVNISMIKIILFDHKLVNSFSISGQYFGI